MGHPFRVHVEVIERTLRGCSLRLYPRLLSGDAFSVLLTRNLVMIEKFDNSIIRDKKSTEARRLGVSKK